MIRCILAILALLATRSFANTDPHVYVTEYDVSGNATSAYPPLDDNENMTIDYLNGATVAIKVTCDSGITEIGRITINSHPFTSDRVIKFSLGTSFDESAGTPTPISGNWHGLALGDRTHMAVWLYGGITGDLKGTVQVDKLYRFDAGGKIGADLLADYGVANVTRVFANSLSAGYSVRVTNSDLFLVEFFGDSVPLNATLAGTVESTYGNLGTVLVDDGNIVGRVFAHHGSAVWIEATNGSISSVPISGDDFPIHVLNGVGTIKAKSINTSITTRADVTFGTGTGRLGQLETTDGDFAGELFCAAIGPSSSPPVYSIRVKGSLSANITTDNDHGLTNPVIYNAGNGSGTWTGALKLGCNDSCNLIPTGRPYYTTADSSYFGGSASGKVPFAVYEVDCTPALTLDGRPSSPTTSDPDVYHFSASPGLFDSTHPFVVRYYGPVIAENNTNRPFRLYRAHATTSGTSYCELTCQTDQVVRRIAGGGSGSREVSIKYRDSGGNPAALPPGTYALTTFSLSTDTAHCSGTSQSVLYCDGLAATTTPVRPTRIGFVITDPSDPCNGPPYHADVDDGSMTGTPDGGVTIDDLLYFLTAFVNGDPAADLDDGSMTGTPDSGVTIEDLLSFLWVFALGC